MVVIGLPGGGSSCHCLDHTLPEILTLSRYDGAVTAEPIARYHHGDLPDALLAATAEAIEAHGVAALSLRDVARRAGVSHAAPAHHFGDKKGLLAAFATQGFELFADALEGAAESSGDDDSARARFNRVGDAYVRFSVSHRAHFEVMWRPEFCDADDPALLEPMARAYQSLHDGVEELQRSGIHADRPTEDVMLVAWAAVHGLAWLILQDRASMFGHDLENLSERLNGVLFPDRPPSPGSPPVR
jgi:AcrR family transcriptional regulator